MPDDITLDSLGSAAEVARRNRERPYASPLDNILEALGSYPGLISAAQSFGGVPRAVGGAAQGMGDEARRMLEEAGSLQRGGSFDAGPSTRAAFGVLGTPLIGPAEGSLATLGAGAMRRAKPGIGHNAMGAGAVKPIRAYHGSPYDFERFDLSKIGTGEGAQVYGHGLYFAENPATAQSYKDAMRVTDMNWPVKGTGYDLPAWVARTAQNSPRALEEVRQNFVGRVEEAKRELAAGDHNASSRLYHTQRVVDALDAVKAGAELQKPGKMYEVNINADPAHFLDWDKPLAQMSPDIQKRLADAWLAHPEAHARQTGAQIYGNTALDKWNLQPLPGPRPEHSLASDALRDLGIPGIKYLDQGSRTAGQGSSNYVLFRDDIIDIVKKYGLAGAAAMYGISQDEAKAAMDNPKDKKMSIGRQSYGDEE